MKKKKTMKRRGLADRLYL